MMGIVIGGGCGWAVSPPRCDRGMTRVDGQCVPKPTLVFRQCVEAFRTTGVERERGDAVAVGASVPGAGSARLEREHTDKDTRELASLPDADTDAIIEECRRQEQAERARLLEEAWAAAEEAKADAKVARAEVRRLESSMAAMEVGLTEAASRLQEEQERGSEREVQLAALRALAEPDHPCELELWPACADAAAADHEAGEFARAHQRYALACQAGQAAACGNWGLMFEHGLGVPADPKRAAALYEEACDADDLQACVHLGGRDPGGGGRTGSFGAHAASCLCQGSGPRLYDGGRVPALRGGRRHRVPAAAGVRPGGRAGVSAARCALRAWGRPTRSARVGASVHTSVRHGGRAGLRRAGPGGASQSAWALPCCTLIGWTRPGSTLTRRCEGGANV